LPPATVRKLATASTTEVTSKSNELGKKRSQRHQAAGARICVGWNAKDTSDSINGGDTQQCASYSRKSAIARMLAKAGMSEAARVIARNASSSKGKVAGTPASRPRA
jgi:hypothetical protein